MAVLLHDVTQCKHWSPWFLITNWEPRCHFLSSWGGTSQILKKVNKRGWVSLLLTIHTRVETALLLESVLRTDNIYTPTPPSQPLLVYVVPNPSEPRPTWGGGHCSPRSNSPQQVQLVAPLARALMTSTGVRQERGRHLTVKVRVLPVSCRRLLPSCRSMWDLLAASWRLLAANDLTIRFGGTAKTGPVENTWTAIIMAVHVFSTGKHAPPSLWRWAHRQDVLAVPYVIAKSFGGTVQRSYERADHGARPGRSSTNPRIHITASLGVVRGRSRNAPIRRSLRMLFSPLETSCFIIITLFSDTRQDRTCRTRRLSLGL
jgi:hypothetical protein